jgi:DNA polymerase-3 subunit delta
MRSVTIDDVRASSGDAGVHSIDDLVYAFASRNIAQSLSSFERLLGEGVQSITLIRSLQNHLLRLHGVKAAMDDHGLDIESAMKMLQPPIFFKQADAFKAQLRMYSQSQLRTLLRQVNELEAKTKQSGMPVETLIGDFLLSSAA